MHVKSGQNLPICGLYFLSDNETRVVVPSATIDIYARNIDSVARTITNYNGVEQSVDPFERVKVVDAGSVTVESDGELAYQYTTPSAGFWAYTTFQTHFA